MLLDDRVRELFEKKTSYVKYGPHKIAKVLSLHPVTDSEIECIRRIKKEVRKNSKYANKSNTSIEINPVANIPEGFVEQFQAMAKALGYEPITNTPASESKITKQSNQFKAKSAKLPTTPPSIPSQVGMHILIGCNHVPFHNVQLHDGLLELIKDYKSQIKGFHLMGDFMDLNTLSFHDRGKFTAVPGLNLNQEYAAGNSLLDQFDKVLPSGTWKTYLYGNHEDRYNRWMSSSDNAKTPLMSPTNALGLTKRGYQVKENWSRDFFTIGKHLDIMHGIYFSIHCAKAHMDKLRGSCAFVHTHRIQSYIEGNTGSFNLGAGADFTSPAFNYATRPMKASWQNGFAIVMIDEDGSYNLTQIICRNNKFYFGGKAY